MPLTKEETELLKAASVIIKREALASPTDGTPSKLNIHGFGTFKFGMSKTRMVLHFKTKQPMQAMAHRTVRFTVSKSWLLAPEETPVPAVSEPPTV